MGAYSLPKGPLTSQIINALETPPHSPEAPASPHPESRPLVVSAQGHHLFLEDGRQILDACGGAAVSCLGYGNQEIIEAVASQAVEVPYVPWAFFDTYSTRRLSDWLIKSTGGAMGKVYIMSSGWFIRSLTVVILFLPPLLVPFLPLLLFSSRWWTSWPNSRASLSWLPFSFQDPML